MSREPLLSSRLRDRVDVEAEQRTSNGQGGWTTSWQPIRSLYAEVVALTGDEALQQGIQRAVVTYRVTIRTQEGITAAHRLKWREMVLAIRSVMPHPKHPEAGLLLICESGNGS